MQFPTRWTRSPGVGSVPGEAEVCTGSLASPALHLIPLGHDSIKEHTVKYNVQSSTLQCMDCTLYTCMMDALESF